MGSGALLTPLSFGIFVLLVEVVGLQEMTASLIRAVAITPLAFLLAAHITWRLRRQEPLRTQFGRYVYQRLATVACHQAVVGVTLLGGFDYRLAYWVGVILTGCLNFALGEMLTFKPCSSAKKHTRTAV